MNLVDYKRNMDKFAWRCMNSKCGDYKKYFSIRDNSFFSDMKIDFVIIFRIIGKYLCKLPQNCIINSIESVYRSTIQKLVKKLVSTIPKPDFTERKLGGLGKIIQADETMLNYKCKFHRGRSPGNRTDALVIVEVVDSTVSRVYATTISNKSASPPLSFFLPLAVSGSGVQPYSKY